MSSSLNAPTTIFLPKGIPYTSKLIFIISPLQSIVLLSNIKESVPVYLVFILVDNCDSNIVLFPDGLFWVLTCYNRNHT